MIGWPCRLIVCRLLIGRSDRLLTWALYGCGRAEPKRKRLVFSSRWKKQQVYNWELWQTGESPGQRWVSCGGGTGLRGGAETSGGTDLVVGVLDVGAVSPLGQDDGLHVLAVQAAALGTVCSRLRRGEFVLGGGNMTSVSQEMLTLFIFQLRASVWSCSRCKCSCSSYIDSTAVKTAQKRTKNQPSSVFSPESSYNWGKRPKNVTYFWYKSLNLNFSPSQKYQIFI